MDSEQEEALPKTSKEVMKIVNDLVVWSMTSLVKFSKSKKFEGESLVTKHVFAGKAMMKRVADEYERLIKDKDGQ